VAAFATGEGQTDPPGVTGKPAANPLPRPALPASLKVRDQQADVLYLGAAPGSIGVVQINFRVPGGAVSGGNQLTFTAGAATATSQFWVR
jgi:uncharacterized protein (TIGR03437 family)